MKKLRVTVEGKAYEVFVEILDEAHAAAPAPVQSVPVVSSSVVAPSAPVKSAAAPAGPGDIPSPLAGKVVSIDVKPGQAVTEGQQVATIEAMKMNTYVYAPRAGTVAEICVTPGDGVDEGKTLVRLA